MATQNPKFKKIRNVTLPVLSIKPNEERYFYFVDPMKLGEQVDPKKEAAHLIHAVDLETGEEGQVIAVAVLRSELEKHYPGDAYVGKCFSIVHKRVPEKKYNIVNIAEIAAPDDFVPPPSTRALEAETAAASKPAAKSAKS